jgi:hypothetical protein
MAKKHANGIDPDIATEEELREYVETKMHGHIRSDLTDYTLWTVFQEEFESFTAERLKMLRTDLRGGLRTHLLRRGVYVAKHNNRYTLSKVLSDVLAEKETHE